MLYVNSDLDTFIVDNEKDMLANLESIVNELQTEIRANPSWYLEPGCDEPTIDVRLCIDLTERYGVTTPTWVIRVGLVDYDQYHSEYCAASCVGLETDVSKLLSELINQLEE